MTEPRAHVDAVVFGAGFAGLYAHHLRGLGLSIQGYEGAADVGGRGGGTATRGALRSSTSRRVPPVSVDARMGEVELHACPTQGPA